MEATRLSPHSKYPIYYSINHTGLVQENLEASKNKSQIALLDEIHRIAKTYKKAILNNKQHVKSLYDMVKNIEFTYYHSNPQNYSEIHNASLLASQDQRFTNGDHDKFPVTSQFFKGCIKINHI